MSQPRADGRSPSDLRPLACTWDIAPQAVGSVLLKCGKTQVICTASVDEIVPRWMKEQNVPGGWLTAEYSMLPASTSSRKPRDSSRGKVDGRSTEIQRLLGRSLRAVTDLTALGPRSFLLLLKQILCGIVWAEAEVAGVAPRGRPPARAVRVGRRGNGNGGGATSSLRGERLCARLLITRNGAVRALAEQ